MGERTASSGSGRVERWIKRAAACAWLLATAGLPTIATAQPAPEQPNPPPAPQEPAPQVPNPDPSSAQQPLSQPPFPSAVPGQTPPLEPAEPPAVQLGSVLPILRFSPGVGVHFDAAGKAHSAFDIDITTGAALTFREGVPKVVDLNVEASYTFSSEPRQGGHLAGVGVTPLLPLHEILSIGLAPKFVVGGTWQGFAVGMRNMLVLPAFGNTFQIEVGHQWLHVEDQDQHELRILVGIDLVRIMVLVVAAQI